MISENHNAVFVSLALVVFYRHTYTAICVFIYTDVLGWMYVDVAYFVC